MSSWPGCLATSHPLLVCQPPQGKEEGRGETRRGSGEGREARGRRKGGEGRGGGNILTLAALLTSVAFDVTWPCVQNEDLPF